MTVRHVLIALNLVAVVAIVGLPDLGRCCRRNARREETTPAEPHAVPRRRGAREPPARARAGLGAALRRRRRGRAAALLAARADPPGRVGALLRQERGRARARCCSRTPRCPTYDAGAVAAVRELPRPEGPGRRSVRTTVNGADGRTGRRRRSTPVLLRFEEDPDCAQPVDDQPDARSATSPTSSPTAGPARRCSRGASTAAARRTTSRSRTSSRTCARSSSSPTQIKAQEAEEPRARPRRPTRRRRARST